VWERGRERGRERERDIETPLTPVRV